MPILRRYGVAAPVEFPLIKRAAVDFATTSNYTPVGSDTRIHIDAASASYTTNVLQVTGSHGWSIAFTAAELTGKLISLVVQDADTKAVEDQFISIETYGSPLAQHPFDFSVSTVTLSQPALDALAVQVVNTVWATGSRTITGTGTDAIAAASIAAAAGSKNPHPFPPPPAAHPVLPPGRAGPPSAGCESVRGDTEKSRGGCPSGEP